MANPAIKPLLEILVLLFIIGALCEASDDAPKGQTVPNQRLSGTWTLSEGSEGLVSLELRAKQSGTKISGTIKGVLRRRYNLSYEGIITNDSLEFSASGNLLEAKGRWRSDGKLVLDIHTRDDGDFHATLTKN